MKSPKQIVAYLLPVVENVAKDLGYSIWDLEYVKEGAEFYLRITIDSDEGIGIEDCEKMSRAIDPVLDEHDVIDDAYHLEVSSPGIERDIKTDYHLSVCIGEMVAIKLYAPIDGSKSYIGVLKSFNEENITVDDKEIPRKAIAKMNIYFQF